MIKVDPITGCHRWQGRLSVQGYGLLPGDLRAHREAWAAVHGQIPPGMVIDHVWLKGCRYRDCVNIDHLECITQAENNRRASMSHKLSGPQRSTWVRHKMISLGL